MISNCLIGNESLTKLLRALTVFTIVKYKKEYLQFIETETSIDTNQDILLSITKKYNSILNEAKTNKCWCNEYHLLAIATLLNTDIFIYSSFYNSQSGEIYQIANNAIELQHIFEQNKRTGAHLIYRPISNSSISDKNDNPIFGYFSFQRKHYTSIIPHSYNSPLFKPQNCIISF
jgi:hypothetical protein